MSIEHVYVETDNLVEKNLAPVIAACGGIESLTVLDVGCGTGAYSRRLHALGAAKVLGIDISGENITLAKSRCSSDSVAFQQEDLERFVPIDRFDFIFARGVIYYCTDPASVLSSFRKWLNPGGRLFLTVTDRTPVTRCLNLVKRGAAALPEVMRPWIRDLMAALYMTTTFPGEEWKTIHQKMNTLFFPERHLMTPDEVRILLQTVGLRVKVLVPQPGGSLASNDFGVLAEAV